MTCNKVVKKYATRYDNRYDRAAKPGWQAAPSSITNTCKAPAQLTRSSEAQGEERPGVPNPELRNPDWDQGTITIHGMAQKW